MGYFKFLGNTIGLIGILFMILLPYIIVGALTGPVGMIVVAVLEIHYLIYAIKVKPQKDN